MTLTYNDDSLPMMHSEIFKGEVISSSFSRGLCPSLQGDFAACYNSLNRKDVQLWLKRFRSLYFREHGERLDLRFTCFGEYGEKHHRPHYHCLFYGLSRSDAEKLRRMWPYGFTDLKYIEHFNDDGSDAFVKVSRYVSKYISKGEFLPDFVKQGLAEKPRRQSSVALGRRDLPLEELKNFISPKIMSWLDWMFGTNVYLTESVVL